MNQRAFAKSVKVTQPHINGIIKGTRTPSIYLAKKIENVTEGKVSVVELLDIKIPNKNLNERSKT